MLVREKYLMEKWNYFVENEKFKTIIFGVRVNV